MKTSWLIGILVVLVLLLGLVYHVSLHPMMPGGIPGPQQAMGTNGSPDQGNMGAPNNGQPQQPEQTGPAPIIGANLALGLDGSDTNKYLIGYTGMPLYTYDKDTTSVSTCYDTCAQNWPPYVVSASDNIQQLEAGVSGTVGTTARTDGTLQLTYDGHPLYFYAKDSVSVAPQGDGVGGVWHIAKP